MAEQLDDAKAMLDLAVEADDESLLVDVQAELDSGEQALGNLEFRRMFSNPMEIGRAHV